MSHRAVVLEKTNTHMKAFRGPLTITEGGTLDGLVIGEKVKLLAHINFCMERCHVTVRTSWRCIRGALKLNLVPAALDSFCTY